MNVETDLRPQNYLFGISLIIATTLVISIQDLVFKLLTGELTLWQIFTLRGFVAVPILLVIGWVQLSKKKVIGPAFGKWPLLRSAFITITFLAFYGAIPFLSLSTVGAANYIAPIYVALLSAVAIKEPVGRLGWCGVVLGFAGVLILLRPGTDAFSAWTLLPVVGAGFYAVAHLITRVKCQDVPLAALSLSQNMMMLLAGLLMSFVMMYTQPSGGVFDEFPYIFGNWSEANANDWLIIVLLAVFAVCLGSMLAGAYKAAPPAIISTFEYSYLVFIVIWDIVFFNVTPTISSSIGMVMIVSAGLLVMRGRVKR